MELTLSRALRVDTSSHLFWLLLGPGMLSFALMMTPAMVPGLIAASGLFVAFRFGWKGALAIFSLLFLGFFIHHDRFLWEAGWNIAVGVSLLVTTFGVEEASAFVDSGKKELEIVIEELKVDYATHQHKSREEIKRLEDDHRIVTEKLEAATENCHSLKQLVQATTIESDKLYREVDELCKLRREDDLLITALRQKMEEGEMRLKELNEVRVENFQLQQLVPQVEIPSGLHPLQEKLQKLENQKTILKQEAEGIEDKEALKLKKKELVAIDRELFNVKKEMRDQGLFFSNAR